jgi:hypothetical protein
MRRRLLLGAGALALFALLLWVTRPRPGITQENFFRLWVGMPKQDVEAILGGRGEPFRDLAGFPMAGGSRVWREGDVTIHIHFGPRDAVDAGDLWDGAGGWELRPPEDDPDEFSWLVPW